MSHAVLTSQIAAQPYMGMRRQRIIDFEALDPIDERELHQPHIRLDLLCVIEDERGPHTTLIGDLEFPTVFQ